MDKINNVSGLSQISPVSIKKTEVAKGDSPASKGDSVTISGRSIADEKPLLTTGKSSSPAQEQAEKDGACTITPEKEKHPSTILDMSHESGQAGAVKNIEEPKPHVDARNARVIEKAFDILKGNRMTIEGHTFTTPSKVVDQTVNYEGKQWLWDSCFHAMVLSEREPGTAKEELRSVVANQHPDGFIPHMNYFRGDAQQLSPDQKEAFENFLKTPDGADVPQGEREKFANTFWSYKDHSDITQPPILGSAVEEVYKATGDKAFVKEMLPAMKAYYNYLHDKRDPDGDNLISIIHQWESGWDHSQRWDETIGVENGDKMHINQKKCDVLSKCKKVGWDLDKIFENDSFNVEPVDFNTLYALNMESLSNLCGEVGDKEGEKLYKSRANATSKAIFKKMWDGDKYVDLHGKNEKKSDVKSAAMFYPMMLDGEKHGKHLIEKHLMNPDEFNTKHTIPTTSIDDPLFSGGEYWRGNVWTNVNFFVWKGLQKFQEKNPGYKPAQIMANRIKDSAFELLDTAGFSEYFDPQKGNGHGAKSFGWNGIVRLMEPDYK
ncbi:MAG: hypothetical protein K8T10_18765 [Candidatus Eremiobacteraeota bacterium]|nr:hypothetical protein [Candidatus Eremiobacteraeota bacterium]